MGLWAVAGSFSMSYKTDGFVPEWYVLSWPAGRRHANQLVKAGKWYAAEKDGEQGWQFHDWLDYQPSAAEIEADREHSRDRQRKRRQKLRESRKKEEES